MDCYSILPRNTWSGLVWIIHHMQAGVICELLFFVPFYTRGHHHHPCWVLIQWAFFTENKLSHECSKTETQPHRWIVICWCPSLLPNLRSVLVRLLHDETLNIWLRRICLITPNLFLPESTQQDEKTDWWCRDIIHKRCEYHYCPPPSLSHYVSSGLKKKILV